MSRNCFPDALEFLSQKKLLERHIPHLTGLRLILSPDLLQRHHKKNTADSGSDSRLGARSGDSMSTQSTHMIEL